MSETKSVTYAALITISIPDRDEFATATVTLSPSDSLIVNGRSKTLGDCTLAELQNFATALEMDIWNDYQSITLLSLDQKEEVNVEVHLLESTLPLEGWHEQAILLDEEAKILAEMTAEPEGKQDAPVTTETKKGKTNALDLEIDTQSKPKLPVENEDQPAILKPDKAVGEGIAFEFETGPEPEIEEEPIVWVAESQPVFEEIEAGEPGAPSTIIQPSQARVRVAGERLPIGHYTQAAVDILVEEPALRAAQAHALSSMSREVAGVLIGPRPEKQPDGRYLVRVADSIVAKHTVMQGASVTYTPESWRYLNDTISERYPDETGVMVGWYHTHPGFGIFLSGMDLFIHENFFTQIWHIALVLDPRAKTSGFFCWDRQKSRVSRHNFAWPHWAGGSW